MADVTKLENYIACDDDTLSELVLPLFKEGAVWTVLDLDSPSKGSFTEEDEAGLQKLCDVFN